MRPRSSRRVFTGSSSSSTTTIGVWVTPPIVRALASSGNASSEICELKRNNARKTSGAGESTFRNERTGSVRAHRAASAAPIASESPIRTTSEPPTDFFRACAAISATSTPMKAMWAPRRTGQPIRPSKSSTASSSAGGSTTSRTAKLTMSKPEEPRAAKNSGLSFSRSKSGWATAKVHSTARLA
jgi:hypothetical protein